MGFLSDGNRPIKEPGIEPGMFDWLKFSKLLVFFFLDGFESRRRPLAFGGEFCPSTESRIFGRYAVHWFGSIC
jgi:hypothetical protein